MSDSDSEGDWEEVQLPEEGQNLEITISAPKALESNGRNIRLETVLRINCHKLHTLALLANGWIRNKWLNDPLLQARLLSLAPLSLQTSFAMIHKSRVPESQKRGRMFETAMNGLARWWIEDYFTVLLEGHVRNRPFGVVQAEMDRRGLGPEDPLDDELLEVILADEGEVIHGPKSLMKHALMGKGSRDVSAQLFTALCRALSIPARLVVSLQSVPWKKSGISGDAKGKGKAKADSSVTTDAEGSSSAPKSAKAKGKEKARPSVKLRKSKGNVLGGAPRASPSDPRTASPVFWTEVFSRPDGRWLPIDPIRGYVNQPNVFDPSFAAPTAHQGIGNSSSAYARPSTILAGKSLKIAPRDNRMVYVVAFEDDGFGRDVTRRYAREYSAKVAKIQGGQKQRGRKEMWWERVMQTVQRPYRLNRDDVEDMELDTAQLMEGMPTTIDGFKHHPVYVLVRHLAHNETLYPAPPQTREIGKFRGESVYPRSAVVSLKTSENWMRSEGRQVKPGEQPIKFVKMRPSTLSRRRELEVLRDGLPTAGEGTAPDIMQGTYARFQTELYVPEPIIAGKIPKNNFGNIDLYVPSMLPEGAAHLPHKGIGKIAKQLGYDYAEAVTGFGYARKRATPIIEGIVVATENQEAILEAYWEFEHSAAEKARVQARRRVLARWSKLITGLQIRKSIQDEYRDRQPVAAETEDRGEDVEIRPGLAAEGGFLQGADSVVTGYQLPHLPFFAQSDPAAPGPSTMPHLEPVAYDMETMEVDEDIELPGAPSPLAPALVVPKSMAELAEETAARLRTELERDDVNELEEEEYVLPSRPAKKPQKKQQILRPSRAPNQTKPKAKSPVTRRVSARKKRKKDEDDSDAEDEISSGPSPAKRARERSSPPLRRSLRHRRTKTETELQQEQDVEDAFRRAVAS
ncbi:unnamed protein product [Mycena citricolor]|uniref:Rad4-domain-containing protein n=1 Tax=Mycena citricolor TaxID=2018698 RepID=A0AAD2I0P5_9AGAR|nr:unnamed protein product [Mycena citricolor]